MSAKLSVLAFGEEYLHLLKIGCDTIDLGDLAGIANADAIRPNPHQIAILLVQFDMDNVCFTGIHP